MRDVNLDEKINIIDALLIAKYYVGLISALDGCTFISKPTAAPIIWPYNIQVDL